MSRSNSHELSNESGHQCPKPKKKKRPKPDEHPDFLNGKPEKEEAVALKGFTGIQAPEPNTPVNQQANSSGQFTSLHLVSLKPNLVINNTPNRFIGGKTGLQLSTWKLITPNSWI